MKDLPRFHGFDGDKPVHLLNTACESRNQLTISCERPVASSIIRIPKYNKWYIIKIKLFKKK